MKGYGQAKGWVANCCRCYWNDQCCSGCGVEQENCDDFTPLFEDDIEKLDYIEQECLRDLWLESEQGYVCAWSDSITEVFLNGKDVSGDDWWSDIERKYKDCGVSDKNEI